MLDPEMYQQAYDDMTPEQKQQNERASAHMNEQNQEQTRLPQHEKDIAKRFYDAALEILLAKSDKDTPESDAEFISASCLMIYKELAGAERAAKEEQIEPVGYLVGGVYQPAHEYNSFYNKGDSMLNHYKTKYGATPLYSHPPTSAPVPSLDRDKLIDAIRDILNAPEDAGIEGCNYGDTDMPSVAVAFGYNAAMEQVKSRLRKHFTTKNV